MQGRTVRLHDRDETIAVVNVSYHGNTLVIMENRGQGSNKKYSFIFSTGSNRNFYGYLQN